MNKNIFVILAVLAIISSSCSDNNYLPGIEAELANLDKEYVTSSSIEEEDSEKIETIADEASIKQVMDEYVQQLMNSTATAKQRVMRTAYSSTPNVVGVFKVGSCGTFKELWLLIDAEDRRQASRIEGNIGDTYIGSSGNIHFKFCLVSADRYYPGGVFLPTPINYDLTLPPASPSSLTDTKRKIDVIVRYHDTEDNNPSNAIEYCNLLDFKLLSDFSGYTQIGNNAALAWGFPNILATCERQYLGPGGNINYGVLTNIEASTGYLHIDDEDKNNKNWIKCYKLGTTLVNSFDAIRARDVYGIIANGNTTYAIALNTGGEKFRTQNKFYPQRF